MEDIVINEEIHSDIETLEHDINNIDDLIKKAYHAMLLLDKKIWDSKEKDKIDEEFLPILRKFSENYSNYLNVQVKFMNEAVQKYEKLDQYIYQAINK